MKELRKSSVYLDQVSKEIQASVLGIRMVPVKTIFTKFPRMLRDLAKASGKKIELQMVGEDTEIDKSLIEELGDPLIHLIRNSADHGIELPEVRLKAGKPETGTVILRARHEGDSRVRGDRGRRQGHRSRRHPRQGRGEGPHHPGAGRQPCPTRRPST